jgi:hippurate hydrolase
MGEPPSILERARCSAARAVALRRRLHATPELGLELPETKRVVLESLGGLPVAIREFARSSGVLATLRGGSRDRSVLLRADMDALPLTETANVPFRSERPGVMHACGHDAHTAMLVHAAHLLAEDQAALRGDVHFMFQAGEEGHHGALRMIEEGLLEIARPAAAFALHIEPRLPVGRVAARSGTMLASTDNFSITLRGRGGHASMPHDAADPIPVACELVTAMHTWVSRNISVFDPVVVTVGHISAGSTHNVIPETATLLGTIRAVSSGARERASAGIASLAAGIASAHGLAAEVETIPGYPETVNDALAVQTAQTQATALLGEDAWIEMPHPVMGAEDFAYVLARVPGTMVLLGARAEDGSPPEPCHSNRMRLNEDALPIGAALHVAFARAVLDAP